MNKFNNQFATQKLLQEMKFKESSVTGGGVSSDSPTSAKFVSGFGDQTAEPAWGTKRKKNLKKEAPSKPINLRAQTFNAVDYQQATKSPSFKPEDYEWDEESLLYVKKNKGKEMQVNENYSRFKKDTVTRTTEEQIRHAMREVNKKLEEANKLLKYTERLQTEITTVQEIKNKKRVSELTGKMEKKIAEVYSRYKKIK